MPVNGNWHIFHGKATAREQFFKKVFALGAWRRGITSVTLLYVDDREADIKWAPSDIESFLVWFSPSNIGEYY